MSVSAVRILVRREVNDTLTDWRILTPIFILVFILPLLLVSAANFAIRFVGDEGTIVTLVPFAMLLVGFIPASFSLITALESFVGERERNSLEALLAMPISDGALYMGKLISALLPPLLSSYVAMSVFAFSLRFRFPDLFFKGLSLEYLLVVLLLIGAKAVLMVSAAVIISSHTSSIRAANLLASFVLLPTAAIVQLEAILIIGSRWDVLWTVVLLLIIMAVALVRTGMGAFNREEILSREHEQLNLRRVWNTFRVFVREYQPAGVAPADYSGAALSLRRFYRRELPALLHDYRWPLAVALFVAIAGIVFGPLFERVFQRIGLSVDRAMFGQLSEPDLAQGIVIGLGQAAQSMIAGLFSILTFGLFAALVPFFRFASVSFVANSLAARGGSWAEFGPDSPLQFQLSAALPHGIIGLPVMILMAAMGIRIGASLMSPPKGFTVGQNMLWSLAQFWKVWLFVALPLFLIAGVIQGVVAPLVMWAL